MKSLEMPTIQGGDGMSGKSIISNSYLEDIGDAIRYKKGSDDTYYPSQMGDVIRSIEGIVPVGTLEIDANGTYDVTEYAEAVVDVPEPVTTSLTVTEDGTYEVPSGVDGYNPVIVNTGIDALRSEINSAVEVSECDPLVEGLTALTAYANEVTGASDTTLSDAVESLVAGYGSGMTAYKVKNVTVPYEIYQDASIMLNWLRSVVPQSAYAVIMRDEAFTGDTRGDGTLLTALFAYNTNMSYARFFNNAVQINSGWSSAYHLSADEGDKYSIFYQE